MLSDVESRSISPVFVGRADELTALTGAFARAAAGEPQAVLVGGEAGGGKTRLLEEFLCAAERSGAVTAVGGCLELGADGLPFAPVATALRALHRQLGPELAQAAAGREDELARLLPDIGSVARDTYDQEGRARLFELTARLLERLAADRPLVVAIEDLHWADRSTRELLGYLFRSLQRSRLVVLATYRTDDIHRRHPLRPFLAELDRLRTVQRIELPRLSRDEVRRQLAGIQGSEPEHGLADQIFDRSEGNPFFVEELATSDYGSCGLSDSLRDLLLVRVEALPETAQRVVRIAARNTTVEYALLAAVAGLGDEELIEGLRAAVGGNVLVPTDDGDGYRFRHALLREAVVEDLLPGERSRLSRRYAEALEADPSLVCAEQLATRLAGYWYSAHDARKALPAVLAAAREARRRHAYAEQVKLLERAMELWDDVPAEERSRLSGSGSVESYPPCGCPRDGGERHLHFLDLLAEAVVAARWDDVPERAYALVKKALKLIDQDRDPARAAWFWMQRSRLVTSVGRGDGWAEISRAQELVTGLPPSAVHADVLAHAAAWHSLHVSEEGSVDLAERAVDLARLVGARDVELNARVTRACLRAQRGDEDSIPELYEVRELVETIWAPRALGRVHANLVDVLHRLGRTAEAVDVAEAGIETLVRHRLLGSAAFVAGNLAEVLLLLGAWDRAAQVLEEWRDRARSARPMASMVMYRLELDLNRGRYERVPALITECRTHLGKNDMEPQYEIPLAQAEMRFEAAHGRFGEAVSALDGALSLLPLLGQEPYVWRLLVGGAQVAGQTRGLPGTDSAEHRRLLSRLEAASRTVGCPSPLWSAWARRFDAELARADGQHRPQLWAEAAAAFEPYGHPFVLADIRHRWAEAQLGAAAVRGSRAGGPDTGAVRERAGALLGQAYAVATRLQAAPLREEIEHLARRARLPLATESVTESVTDAGTGAVTGAGSGAVTEAVTGAVTGARTGVVTDALAVGRSGSSDSPAEVGSTSADAGHRGVGSHPESGGQGRPGAGTGGLRDSGSPSRPDDGSGLTRRERDVLRLVALGHSNRRIAEELFISPKTASVHVSNILAKLGVSNRGEAASVAHRMRLFAGTEPTV
ncbi:AAA family ATPase [Streptomyces sp. NPDC002055]|uniref:helix-turn-helix transcriptional regulator n=1 Tax=Streptomyces sp. NPDC002055 TaxID=3154534 RepID=UPI003328C0EB